MVIFSIVQKLLYYKHILSSFSSKNIFFNTKYWGHDKKKKSMQRDD